MLPKKLGAMMFLFMVASPIGSFVRIIMLMLEHFYPTAINEGNAVTENGTSVQNILSTILSSQRKLPFANMDLNGLIAGNGVIAAGVGDNIKHNITVEEIIQAVFNQYSIPIESFYHPLRNQPWSSPNTHRLDQDLQMVIPWIFAFTTLIIIPSSLVVVNALWRRGEMETAMRNKRITTYELCLQNYQKEVLPEDIITPPERKTDNPNYTKDTNSDNSNEEWDRDDTFIIIPKPGVPTNMNSNQTNSQLRQVAGTCAICLSSYKKGETIVWSSSKDCSHAFHMSCIGEWIKKQYTSSCPCCRRNFVDSEVYTKVKISGRNVI